jgi:NAD-dependent SIR2 family protein deacetylase
MKCDSCGFEENARYFNVLACDFTKQARECPKCHASFFRTNIELIEEREELAKKLTMQLVNAIGSKDIEQARKYIDELDLLNIQINNPELAKFTELIKKRLT